MNPDLTGCLHSDVMIGVDTDVILLQAEGILAGIYGLELVVVLEVRPTPQPAVDHVGKTLAMGHLIGVNLIKVQELCLDHMGKTLAMGHLVIGVAF